MDKIDYKIVNSLRINAMEMINRANSGHPGVALGFAPTLYTLYRNHFRGSHQSNVLRDRFVLSVGHGSSLLYALLNAFGYDVSVDDLKNFRQLGSCTPGHPEVKETHGVDTSTGPLGQGLSNAVGMALAQKMFAARFNKRDIKLFDNYTYVAVGDGCLMEGVSHEVLSWAGSLNLDKLIVLYDNNNITIEGDTSNTFSQDTCKLMESYGFATFKVEDGNDLDAIDQAIAKAKKCGKPAFISIKTVIGYGTSLAGNPKVHGNPIGAEELQKLIKLFGHSGKPFTWTKEEKDRLKLAIKQIDDYDDYFDEKLLKYSEKYTEDFMNLSVLLARDFTGVEQIVNSVTIDKELSTREIGGKILNAMADNFAAIVGGSGDVGSSTKTLINNSSVITKDDFTGQNIQFGVREFGMNGIANGVALYGGFTPYVSTYFVFSDYLRNALRMSALMDIPVRYIFPHDSICTGEDGPTHQPVEQLWGLRSMPNLNVWRPCDINECKAAYIEAFTSPHPSALILTRQKVNSVEGSNQKNAVRGGYIVYHEQDDDIDAIIIATGSEVGLAVQTAKMLEKKRYSVRVVSMPCLEVFDSQPASYRNKVLPNDVRARVAVEAGATNGWYKYVGLDGDVFGIDTFGKSAPGSVLYEDFGFNPTNLAKMVVNTIKRND